MSTRFSPIAAAVIAVWFGVSGAGAVQPTGVSSELARAATTTPEEKIAYAEAGNTEIAEATRTIEKLLDTAKRGNASPDALQCLSTRLADIRLLGKVAQDAMGAMREWLAINEIESANHEFRKIAAALARARGLLSEAYTCNGEEVVGGGTTQTEYTEPEPFDDNLGNPDDDLNGFTDLGGTPPAETAIL